MEIQYVKGVGPARAKTLLKLGIKTMEDLIYHFPRDWVDRSNITPINKVSPGEKETVRGVVMGSDTRRVKGNLKITRVLIQDDNGYIEGVWYNQPYIERAFKKGDEVIFHGKVEIFRGKFQISVPEYEVTGEKGDPVSVNRIVPIYPLTEKLTQKQFRKIIRNVLDSAAGRFEEYMPDEIMKEYGLEGLGEAVNNIHFPGSFDKLARAKKRLIFDEFFFLQLAFASRKKTIKEHEGIVFNDGGKNYSAVEKNLPFTLTDAQQRVLSEINNDFKSGKPMNRLLQGDVGSGKTIVAFLAAAAAADNGAQAAIMAPTEILASQHMENARKIFENTGVKAGLLLGGTGKKEREAVLEGLKHGDIDVIIGTHALIQEDIEFKKLGFAVIDEQHRFGVMQRAKLVKKGNVFPHVLIMSATPIPRTLSMSVYGDTDVSVIDTLPPGRKEIKTMVFADNDKAALYSFVGEKVEKGAQVYAVYPLVKESEKLDLKSAIEMEKEWSARFKGHLVALIHGQMKKAERDSAMEDFKAKKISILVSTTVIEVGIDVPNASVMVIEHAERFGLSQLHQLRGRVGRGEAESFCILVGDPSTEDGMKRLNIMANTSDGFRISEEDLEIRGPGEFMGARQHGLPEFRIGNIIKDRKIMESAKKAAFSVVSGDCDINHRKKEGIFSIIKRKFGENFNLINIG